MKSELSRYKTKINYFIFNYKIIGRVACLGQDVINGLGWSTNVLNHQKNRVDYILNSHQNKSIKPKTKKLNKYFIRKDILPLVLQQRDEIFTYMQPKLFIIDSFSELTDQRFRHKNEGWEFLSNYSDINHSEDFSNTFENLGLLDIKEMEKYYNLLFFKINQTYNNIPIIFMHFPTTLDRREKFKKRGKVILDTVNQISKKLTNLYSFDIPETIVDWPNAKVSEELEEFPYHYNNETYNYLINKIEKYSFLDPTV